jgi:hypothetical protein
MRQKQPGLNPGYRDRQYQANEVSAGDGVNSQFAICNLHFAILSAAPWYSRKLGEQQSCEAAKFATNKKPRGVSGLRVGVFRALAEPTPTASRGQ